MYKDKISKVAINLFSHYGIRGVSMSQIAGALQMSKKTLYEEFDNKEQLLLECLKNEKERIKKILTKTEQSATNSLELIVLTISDMYHYKSNFCPSFFKDIQNFEEANNQVMNLRAALYQKYMNYFQQGIKDGYFLTDYKYEAISSLFVDQLNSWNNTIPQQPYIVLAFLRGICTTKGIEILNNMSFSHINKEQ